MMIKHIFCVGSGFLLGFSSTCYWCFSREDNQAWDQHLFYIVKCVYHIDPEQ